VFAGYPLNNGYEIAIIFIVVFIIPKRL